MVGEAGREVVQLETMRSASRQFARAEGGSVKGSEGKGDSEGEQAVAVRAVSVRSLHDGQ